MKSWLGISVPLPQPSPMAALPLSTLGRTKPLKAKTLCGEEPRPGDSLEGHSSSRFSCCLTDASAFKYAFCKTLEPHLRNPRFHPSLIEASVHKPSPIHRSQYKRKEKNRPDGLPAPFPRCDGERGWGSAGARGLSGPRTGALVTYLQFGVLPTGFVPFL